MEVVRNQVKYMGLVEILRIRKAGFAYRGKFEEFLNRYKSLCPDTWPDWKRRFATACDAVTRLIDHLGYTDEDCKIRKYGDRYAYYNNTCYSKFARRNSQQLYIFHCISPDTERLPEFSVGSVVETYTYLEAFYRFI